LGLFSDTAGLLASHTVQVRSAVLHTVQGVAVNTWRVDKQVVSDLFYLTEVDGAIPSLSRAQEAVAALTVAAGIPAAPAATASG